MIDHIFYKRKNIKKYNLVVYINRVLIRIKISVSKFSKELYFLE